ncbi:MAG: sugar phosphate isomerase/epimerase [Verrucomicrobiales bacterium]|nr:sugar phosphate isomerase/epimerase [Verrucomicrobiales bacterium]
MKQTSRRNFLSRTALSMVAGSSFLPALSSLAQADKKPLFRISLAQWTLVKDFKSGKLDNLQFAEVAAKHGIEGLEYVNQFFMDKAGDEAYLAQMKKRAADNGVESVLIMCDREGNLGDPDSAKRKKTVDNHLKWINAAKLLGCHSIRVNARSKGSWGEQVKLAADGLAQLTELAAKSEMNVIVENHGGLSSNGKWLLEVIKTVKHDRCGTLPDFGNFKVSDTESYDAYKGVEELMPYAKGVSVKDTVWTPDMKQVPLDFEKMLTIVLKAGYRGFCGIEFGGYQGLNQSREALEKARTALASKFEA